MWTYDGYIWIFKSAEFSERPKVAGFDFDDTIFFRNKDAFVFSSVPSKIQSLYKAGYCILIVSNQSAKGEHLEKIKDRVTLACELLGVPVCAHLCVTPNSRKPGPVGWSRFSKSKNCFFVGDAAGRPGDHSAADIGFATNLGIDFYTPVEYFCCKEPRKLRYAGIPSAGPAVCPKSIPELPQTQEVVLLVGHPGSGKSTLARMICAQDARYETIGNDMKNMKRLLPLLAAGKSVLVDNTHTSREQRKKTLSLIPANVAVRCVVIDSDKLTCFHNIKYRAIRTMCNPLPQVALLASFKRYERPECDEGFSSVDVGSPGPPHSSDKLWYSILTEGKKVEGY